jgi:hypothetical protein
LAGASNVLINADVEDQQYATNGKATPSKGILVSGLGNQILGGHFSSLTLSLDLNAASGTRVDGISVFAGTYGVAQPFAVSINAACADSFISIEDDFGSGATKSIQNQSATTIYHSGGSIFLGNTSTVFDHDFVALTIGGGSTKTISGGVATCDAGFHVLAAESGTADSVSQVRDKNGTAGVGQLLTGQKLTVVPDAGDTITLKHDNSGANELHLSGSVDAVLSSDKDSLTLMWNGAEWVEVGRTVSAQTVFTGSDTWDPVSIAAYQTKTTNVTCTGAVEGMLVSCSHSDMTNAAEYSLYISGYVVAGGGSVQVTISNMKGGAVPVGEGTVKVRASAI